MKSLKYIVLAFTLGCGGNSSENDRDGNNPYQDLNSMYDSSSGRNNKKDSGRHPYDSGLEGRLDAGVDDLGREPDMGVDAGRCPPREIIYPFADLICEAPDCRVNEDCLYEFSVRRDRTFCWDASPSMVGPGRNLASYRLYPAIEGAPGFRFVSDDSDICFALDTTGSYHSRLEVIDDVGDIGSVDYITSYFE